MHSIYLCKSFPWRQLLLMDSEDDFRTIPCVYKINNVYNFILTFKQMINFK